MQGKYSQRIKFSLSQSLFTIIMIINTIIINMKMMLATIYWDILYLRENTKGFMHIISYSSNEPRM